MAKPGAGAPGNLARIRELCERGLARAAESLTRLLGCPVRFADPEVRPVRASALPDPADAGAGSLVALRIAIHGQGSGWILILLPLPTVHRILQVLTGTPAAPRGLTAVERSAIQEVGNIVASSFLGALGDQVGRRFLPSAPECGLDAAVDVVRGVLASVRALDPNVWMVQAALEDAEGWLQGRIVIVPDVGAWEPVCHGATSG